MRLRTGPLPWAPYFAPTPSGCGTYFREQGVIGGSVEESLRWPVISQS